MTDLGQEGFISHGQAGGLYLHELLVGWDSNRLVPVPPVLTLTLTLTFLTLPLAFLVPLLPRGSLARRLVSIR